MLIVTLLQAAVPAATPSAQKVFNLQALSSAGNATALATFLSPAFSSFAQVIKHFPFIRNHWVRIILPIAGVLTFSGFLFYLAKNNYIAEPMSILMLGAAFLIAASAGAEAFYKLPVFGPGPDNHPTDAQSALEKLQGASASFSATPSPPIPPPTPAAPVPVAPSASQVGLPPSPFNRN